MLVKVYEYDLMLKGVEYGKLTTKNFIDVCGVMYEDYQCGMLQIVSDGAVVGYVVFSGGFITHIVFEKVGA